MSELVNYLPGLPEQFGIKQPAPSFALGEDVVLTGAIKTGIVVDRWTNLECLVKKSAYANNTLWRVTAGAGLTVGSTEYQMIMPASVSGQFLPGSYHAVLVGKQKVGTGTPVDRFAVLAESMFELRLSAASPNPKLSGSTSTLAERDPETGVITVIKTSVEQTLPLDADATSN
ncbi:MAG: hypothetical protein EBU46_08930 [Nitrosomonadaceae bacterium]|nr:hypothetical protein [Nitrosomonadaceae bacterium]